MTNYKKIWVLRPTKKMLWTARTKAETEFVERFKLADWILNKQSKGDVVIVEQLHVDGTSEEE